MTKQRQGRSVMILVSAACIFVLLVFAPSPALFTSIEYRRWLSCFESPRLVVENNNSTIPTDKCPAIIREQQGIYSNNATATTTNPFQNVVLLTAANSKFTRFLTNWEILAREQGLKWVVLAFDEEIMYRDNDSLLISHDKQISYAGRFRTESYNTLVCNKIRMVRDILQDCGNVEIVFSDVDNVFLQDPFQHDLGRMIRTNNNAKQQQQRYDYIYQTNDAWTPEPRQHSCIRNGVPTGAGNTGFHYLRPTKPMLAILEATLVQCDKPDNVLDDQTLFWRVLSKSYQRNEWKHCGPRDSNRTTGIQQESSTTTTTTTGTTKSDDTLGHFCCLDPHYYATGKLQPNRSDDLVSLHANYISNIKMKEKKLREWTTNGWRMGMPV